MPASVRPFLMFQGDGPAAVDFYLSIFPDASLDIVERQAGEGDVGAIRRGVLTMAGQAIMIFDSPAVHDFSFTPAVSLFVTCTSAAEVRDLAGRLGEGGKILMPPGAHGFSTLFAWVNDRFGLSWQLNFDE